MFVFIPVVILFSATTTIVLVTYCKSRDLKKQQTLMDNARGHMRPNPRRPSPGIYIVPTTNQVMEMYINNAESRSNNQCKPPPSYGQVVVDIPPSYEEAVVRTGNGAS